jgi:ferrochelatase
MSATPKPKVTVVLANLGTPDEATVPAVRRFLKQFLSDTRVIEIPKPIWWIILHLFVLTFRPKRVAEAYASVWSKDSPMREIVLEQTELVKQRLQSENQPFDLTVVSAMTYGQPSIYGVFEQLEKNPQEHVILLPLFPQYSATSTAPLYDAFAKWIPKQRHLPGLTLIKDYYQHPMFIQALADILSVQFTTDRMTDIIEHIRYKDSFVSGKWSRFRKSGLIDVIAASPWRIYPMRTGFQYIVLEIVFMEQQQSVLISFFCKFF